MDPQPKTITWVRSTVSVQSGEYAEAQTLVTQYASADGRFTITPTGGMIYKRTHGARGAYQKRFAWHGFMVKDALADKSRGQRMYWREQTVSAAKRSAEAAVKRSAARAVTSESSISNMLQAAIADPSAGRGAV
jgi:hypothetical protein